MTERSEGAAGKARVAAKRPTERSEGAAGKARVAAKRPNFLTELRRRNVIRMAGLYLVGAWLIVQIAETLLPAFDVPNWVLRAIIIVLALGFIPALVFSWIFELTPEGLKRDEAVATAHSIAPQTAKRMDQLTLVGVLLVLAVIGADRMWPRDDESKATSAARESTELTKDPRATPEPTSPPSVAVLPFANLSSDPEQEYFSDGMTEELLNVLAKVPGLKVAARTSVFEFKNKGGDVREIGGKLGVSHVIEGSVRRDGQQIRVTAQLIRVADGFHVWSESYDRKLEGIFALQDDLAKRVGSALQASLGIATRTAPRASIKPAAYDDYLKGRALLRKRTDIRTAIAHFQSSVAQEPDFAAGWSALSLTYDVGYGYIEDLTPDQLSELIVKQEEAAERAFSIEPDSATVNHALGNVARKRLRYAEAERRFLQAMQIDPSYPDVREDYAELLHGVGRVREARLAAQQLVQLDPFFGIGWVRMFDTSAHLDLRSEVEEAVARVQALMPDNSLSTYGLLTYAITWGRVDEARTQTANITKRWPDDSRFASTLLPWALEGAALDDQSIKEALLQAPSGIAIYYLVARGDRARYDQEFERSGATMQGFYFSYLNDDVNRGHVLLRDPQVKANLERYGFVAYWREKGWPPACRPLGDSDFECGIDATDAPKP